MPAQLPDSAAALSARTVVIPSSCQSRRAVFGPEAGKPHEGRDLGRHLGLALRERVNLAVLDRLDDLLLDRLADSLELLGTTVECQLGDRATGLADSRSRAAIRRDPEGIAALELHQVGEQVELRCEVGVPRQRAGHGIDDTAAADACDRLPADLQRAREPRADAARARQRAA